MATIKNLVKFAAKFLDMAKAKGKTQKKAAPKSKSKPVAKKAAKPDKKAAPKPKKAAKPAKAKAKPVVKKAKPVVKKAKPVAKKAVKPAPKKAAKPVKAVKPVVKKAAVKPVAKPATHAKAAVKPAPMPQAKKNTIAPKPQPVKPAAAAAPKQQIKPQQKKNMKETGAEHDLNLRYSDEELKEFRDLIEKKLIAAREELKNLKESLDNHTESQAGNKAWNMEEGTDTSEMEYLMNQISRQHQYIRNLELALIRVENKTYGICRVTGKLIPKERLRIVPHATLSLEAKMTRKTEEVGAGGAAAAPPLDFSEGFED